MDRADRIRERSFQNKKKIEVNLIDISWEVEQIKHERKVVSKAQKLNQKYHPLENLID